METVKCGRPGTGMPYFSRDSYPSDGAPQCYGLTTKDLETMHVAQAGVFLRPEEIEAVTDYVISSIKGKGDPNLADCVAFFGEGSKACDVYKGGGHHACQRPQQRNDRGSRPRAWPLFVALGPCLLFGISGDVAAESISDLRGIDVGMSVRDLPASGYRNVSCVGTTSQPLGNWSDWKSCAAGPDGLRRVHLEYDQPGQDETLVAGHPVDLSVSFDDSGRLVRIEIET